MIWLLIMGALLIAFVATIVYLTNRFCKFKIIKNLSRGKKWLERLLGMIPIAFIVVVLWITMGYMNAIIVVLHLAAVWLIGDAITLIIAKCRKKNFQKNYTGVAAIVFTVIYLCVGWYLAHNVWRTAYEIETDKAVGNIRIVLFSDSHVGTTFDGDGWKQYIDRMNAENPDVVLITGDFVDDDTSKEDMINSCKAMGDLKTKYGVYFAFGNHDKGYYAEHRGYSGDDLIEELQKNNVKVLQDENVLIDDRFYIIGRQDRSEEQKNNARADMDTLVKSLDKNKFSIVMDHQPYDYEGEAEAKVDLVLSGHTHGGQLIPVNHVGEWTGENAKTYGYKKKEDTNFIVTSGISDWAIKFKTGCKSEYVVIDINPLHE